MTSRIGRGLISVVVGTIALAAAAPALAKNDERELRFATFNASVNRNADGQLLQELSNGDDPQLQNVAEIIQRARPDVLLINEFDFVPDQQAARLFQKNYLSVPHNGARAIKFPFRFVAPSNTGIASGKDLDNNGQVVTTPGSVLYGNDSFGFGEFPGQVRHGRLLAPADRLQARADLPALPLEGHAGGAASSGVVFARRARRLPALVQEPLGPADRDRPREAGPLPREPSDAAGVRRPGGPQRAAEPRRDPLLGGLHQPRRKWLHLRRRGTPWRPSPRRALRDRRRPERRPVRRRQRGLRDPPAA